MQAKKDNSKRAGKYYTPKHIMDYIKGENVANPTVGSGAFLKQVADKVQNGLTKNPPYSFQVT